MKITWESEDWPGARIDPGITHLSWMGQPDKPGHGLLGVGSESGAVGITLTDLNPCEDDAQRYNFNLRGHHSTICMVAWNRAQCKLASCDASGVIYVWVRNDDRWSVELVNDRGVKVRDLSWSPCGSAALICYEDNFVLIGSATGQRVWSNAFHASTAVTCGVWAADSRELVLGFASGCIQVLSDQGANITERSLCDEPLAKLACSPAADGRWTLAVLTESSRIIIVSAYDQVVPFSYDGDLSVKHMEWNSAGTLLAVISGSHEILLFDREAHLVHREKVPVPKDKHLSALTWAHEGRALVVAAGGHLAVGRLLQGVPSLFNLVTYDLWRLLGSSSRRVERLPLPQREKNALRDLDHHIIRCRIPRQEDLCNFVCTVHDARCYCTIRPLSRGSHSYVLCMEHMGGLVPLLVGRQVNRFLPQFHVALHPGTSGHSCRQPAGSSAQVEDISILPRPSTGRNSLWRRSKRQLRALMSRHVRVPRQDLRLVHVSSNVWCTRFNVASMAPQFLPDFLAQIVYKTSVLHLQPRQMTVQLADLTAAAAAPAAPTPVAGPFLAPPTQTPPTQTPPTASPVERENDAEDDLAQLLASQRLRDAKGGEDGLTQEERVFFDRVLSECASLRAAMELAVPSTSTGAGPSDSPAHMAPPTCARILSASLPTSPSLSHSENISLATSAVSWQEEVDSMEYIDGADEQVALLHAASEHTREKEREKEKEKEQEDIRKHLDKLARIAEQLSHRHADFNAKRDRASITKMRVQMKELLRRVNEIEKKVGPMEVGSGDVRGEVRQLVRTIEEMKRALGEGGRDGRIPRGTLTMHNKTPFWNEHNQVYQLDFGGRVTQESAKNFQIEVDTRQVLQFGRIEGGAYTLDFRQPFCAAQAFAVALASITQRLK